MMGTARVQVWLKERFLEDEHGKQRKWERFKGPYMSYDILQQLGDDIQDHYFISSDDRVWYKRDDTIPLTENETSDSLSAFMGRDLKLLLGKRCWEVRIIPAC